MGLKAQLWPLEQLPRTDQPCFCSKRSRGSVILVHGSFTWTSPSTSDPVDSQSHRKFQQPVSKRLNPSSYCIGVNPHSANSAGFQTAGYTIEEASGWIPLNQPHDARSLAVWIHSRCRDRLPWMTASFTKLLTPLISPIPLNQAELLQNAPNLPGHGSILPSGILRLCCIKLPDSVVCCGGREQYHDRVGGDWSLSA